MEPRPVVRAVVLERDLERCVSCSVRVGLQMQHRQAVGMGGSKHRPLAHELITACAVCNAAYEGALQPLALKRGWKVRRWVRVVADAPVWYPREGWFRLKVSGERVPILTVTAHGMMRAVYGEEWAL